MNCKDFGPKFHKFMTTKAMSTHFGTHVMTLCKRTGDLFRSSDGAEPTKQILERDFVGNDFLFHKWSQRMAFQNEPKNHQTSAKKLRCPVPGSAQRVGREAWRVDSSKTRKPQLDTLKVPYDWKPFHAYYMLLISNKKNTKKTRPRPVSDVFFCKSIFYHPVVTQCFSIVLLGKTEVMLFELFATGCRLDSAQFGRLKRSFGPWLIVHK